MAAGPANTVDPKLGLIAGPVLRARREGRKSAESAAAPQPRPWGIDFSHVGLLGHLLHQAKLAGKSRSCLRSSLIGGGFG
eukprot:10265412-Alexandrium_andersonii.AAC.1